MSKLAFTLLLVLFFSESCKDSKPVINFDAQEIAFKVRKGQVFTAQFDFQNVGSGNLMILSVNGDCTCTNISYSKEQLGSNQKGVIIVHYDSTSDSTGIVEKNILVESNTVPALTKLKLIGELY